MTGRMLKFLNMVSPALASQVVHAKSTSEAFDLLSNAMAKIEDPAKRAALAQKTVGDASLAPLLARGSKGVQELRDHYAGLAGSQEGAVRASEETHEAMRDLSAATDGVKAALIEGLAPALTEIIKKITTWLGGHREDIKQWAASIGEKLPGAFDTLVGFVKTAVDTIGSLVDKGWRLKAILGAVAALMAGRLIDSIFTLSKGVGKLMVLFETNPMLAGVTAVAVVVAEIWEHWDGIASTIKEILVDLGLMSEEAQKQTAGRPASAGSEVTGASTLQAIRRASQKAGGMMFQRPDLGMFQRSDMGGPEPHFALGAGGLLQQAPSVADQARSAIAAGAGHEVVFAPESLAALHAVVQGASATQKGGKITVAFANAPRGLRVTSDKDASDVDLSVGYQLGGATP